MHRSVTPCATMASSNRVASNFWSGSVTTVPPRFNTVAANTNPVPCMSGAAGKPTGGFASALTRSRTCAASADGGSLVVLDAM